MSANLSSDSGQASNPNPAATDSNVSADNAAVDTAASSAERTEPVAASETPKDAIAKLDSDYKKNMLGPEEEVAKAEPEKAEPEPEVEAKPEEVEEVAEPVDDPEEQTGPRTLEALKKQFPRVSDKPLAEIARVEAEHYKLQQEVDSVGGTIGLEIAKGLIPPLTNASPSVEDSDTVFQTVAETNPALLQSMSWNILTHSLTEERPDPTTGRPINQVTGDAIIKQFLNPNYDLEKIEKLIAFDEAGLLDHEELGQELENFSGKSKREQELEARLRVIEEGNQKAAAEQTTKAEARVQQHIAKTEAYVTKNAMEQIVPIAEQYGWTATKEEINSSDPAVKARAEAKIALGELLTPWLDSFVRNHVKWAGVESIGKREEAFNADGNPTMLLKKNGQEVINAAIAAFKSQVRRLNPSLASAWGQSRNAQLKAKTTRSGAVEPSKIPPVKEEPSKTGNLPKDDIARLDEEYQRTIREQRASL